MTSGVEVIITFLFFICLLSAEALDEDFVRSYFSYAILVFLVLLACFTVGFSFFPNVNYKLFVD